MISWFLQSFAFTNSNLCQYTGAAFFIEYMSANRIPYAYGESAKVADISGESFILVGGLYKLCVELQKLTATSCESSLHRSDNRSDTRSDTHSFR